MANLQRLCVLLVAVFSKVLAQEDLLDEYVRHIDSLNRDGDVISDRISRRNQRFVTDWKHYDGQSRRLKREIPNYHWTHSETLDARGDVVLRWQTRHQEILFRVEARTRGYVGIGFSPNGGMEDADIVIAWVDDAKGTPYILDCHGAPKGQGSQPIKDEIDNYTLMKGIQNDTHTIIEFRRVLDTCDEYDYVLTADTVRVIWALHDNDPESGAEMLYHDDKRGTQSLHLFRPSIEAATDLLDGVSNWDVALNNFEVSNNMNTIYWCKIFKAPDLKRKHHIIGYEPLIGANHSAFVHHMLLKECQLNGAANTKWDTLAKEKGRPCYDDYLPEEWERCMTPLVAYGVGSKGEHLPNEVGLPLTANSYYMLEVHFDNPSMKKAVDSTGFRLLYTSNLRKHEGGMFVAGVGLSYLHFIPPMQNEYRSAGLCSMGCTKELFPKEGIHIVSVVLHSHLAGRKMKLRHIRADKELTPIVQDDHYDFNYQQTRALSPPATVLPGDTLVTECTYSTAGREKPTFGGYSTKDEMCMAFVVYYPRTELAACYSVPPVRTFFEALGVREFYGKTMLDIERTILKEDDQPVSSTSTTTTRPHFPYQPGDEMSPEANNRAIIALKNAKDYTIEGEYGGESGILEQLIIKEPLEYQNKTFMSHLQNLPFNENSVTKNIEKFFYTGLHLTFCRKRDDTPAIREIKQRFPNFTAYTESPSKIQCSNHIRGSASLSVSDITMPHHTLLICTLSLAIKFVMLSHRF